MDVHARSTHTAAVSATSGELSRARFGGEIESVVDWLAGLPAPVHAVYEAGPTGYRLARAAAGRGVRVDVIAPGKTPRATADRIKTDRRDAELLVRQLMAGSLCPIHIPSRGLEAARDLVRAREDVRCGLMRARHRVSKLLLRHGQVYPREKSTWTTEHHRWLASRRFDESNTELADIDALAAVDGLISRRDALAERLSHVASDAEVWPIVARLRAFRGIDTLTALALVCEIGDWHRFPRPHQLAAWVGLVPSLAQSGEARQSGAITKTDAATPAGCWSRRPGTTSDHPASARPSRTAKRASPTTFSKSAGAHSTDSTASTNGYASAANTPPWSPSPRPANWPASAGRQPPHPKPTQAPDALVGRAPGPLDHRHARCFYGQPPGHTRS
ncbi:MAG: IS110 family RNA-guided transposase [Gaiellales bacterium]